MMFSSVVISWKFLWCVCVCVCVWGGISKAKIFNGKHEAQLEFLEGWGIPTKEPSMGGVWIFFGTTLLCS